MPATERADARSSLIQKQVQEKMASARWSRCLKRLGWVMATLGFAGFKSYAELQTKFDDTSAEFLFDYLPEIATVKAILLAVSLLGIIFVIVAYLLNDIRRWLQAGISQLWPRYIEVRRVETVDLPKDALLQFVFDHGDARNPGSFIRLETLHWLAAINTEYVGVWAQRGGPAHLPTS